MARDRATLRMGIWGDDDWRALTRDAQWLYQVLLTHPTLSYAGVADWRPAKIAALSTGTTAADIRRAASELASRHFVVIDDDTEEIMVRSFLRHDGILQRPNVTAAMVKAYLGIASNRVRGVLTHELMRLKNEHAEWPGWHVTGVDDILKNQPVDPKADPSPDPSVDPSPDPADSTGNPSPDPSPTTATSTSTQDILSSAPPRKPETRLPPDWMPTASHLARAKELGLSLDYQAERFRAHAEVNDRRCRSWNRAFTEWLDRADPAKERHRPEPVTIDKTRPFEYDPKWGV